MNRIGDVCRGLYCCVLLIGALSGAGCTERMISITSSPEGALVYLNDEEVGRTPVRVPFTFYGTYDVRLQKQGYAPLWTSAEAKAPWWELPGPDLIGEMTSQKVLVEWHFIMEKRDENDPDPVLRNAYELRDQTVGPTTQRKSAKPGLMDGQAGVR